MPQQPIGRFAPSPTGRMHLGNVYAALMSWLATKHKGGLWKLRIEDIDPQRSKTMWIDHILDDLQWLGLIWDGEPVLQSQRSDIYAEQLNKLRSMGLTYRCHCTRADIMATQAPHQSDGRVVYAGTCRPRGIPPFSTSTKQTHGTERLWVPNSNIIFNDATYGPQKVNLQQHCGDFVLRRSDGAWAYQLAVVTDDALMGITQVVRGNDLLLSAAQQTYLYELLGFDTPEWTHIPLMCNTSGLRLSKRDHSLSLEALRQRYTTHKIFGIIANAVGWQPTPDGLSLDAMLGLWQQLPAVEKIILE